MRRFGSNFRTLCSFQLFNFAQFGSCRCVIRFDCQVPATGMVLGVSDFLGTTFDILAYNVSSLLYWQKPSSPGKLGDNATEEMVWSIFGRVENFTWSFFGWLLLTLRVKQQIHSWVAQEYTTTLGHTQRNLGISHRYWKKGWYVLNNAYLQFTHVT